MQNQLIFVLTAASATGKSSCAKEVCKKDKDLVLSISHSTRPMRPGEIEGVDKFFITEVEFSQMQEAGEFIESTEIFGHRCGHTKEKLKEVAGKSNDLIMILDYQGMCQVKAQFENTVSIFLLPPSMDAIYERIHKRPEASGVDIESRIISAKKEMLDYSHYDYVVINDDLNTCVDEMLTIVRAERLKTKIQSSKEKKRLNSLMKD